METWRLKEQAKRASEKKLSIKKNKILFFCIVQKWVKKY